MATISNKTTWGLPLQQSSSGLFAPTKTSTPATKKPIAPLNAPKQTVQGVIDTAVKPQNPIPEGQKATAGFSAQTPQSQINQNQFGLKAGETPEQYRARTQSTSSTTSAGTNINTNPNGVTYRGLVGRIAGASTPNKTQTGLVSRVVDAGAGNQQYQDQAKSIAEKYGSEIARIGKQGAGAVAGDLSTGTNVVGSGNAAIASQSASQRMQALSNAGNFELSGVDRGLAGQNQQATAFNSALGAANTQQAQQLAGLGSAAGLSQPVQVPYGNQFLNPTTGESAGGAGLGGYSGYKAFEQATGLGGQYPDSGYQYNPALSPEQNLAAAQKAIQGSPTYQKSTYGVPGQQNIPGATVIQTAQQGYQQASLDYTKLYSAFQNADSLADNVVNILGEGGINPTDVKYANQTITQVKRNLSSVQQQRFDTALQEARNAFAGVVASYGGQTPTDIGNAYNTLLDPSASMGAINAAIGQLKLAGQTRLQSEYQRVQTFYNQLQSGTGAQSTGGGGSFDW